MPATKEDIVKRRQCERRRLALENDRSSFMAHWRDISDHTLPRRTRFVTSDTNRGDKRNQKIVDSTATDYADIMEAGLMSGITNPAQPWFKLSIADPDLAENPAVKAWLYEVQQRMESVFERSNLYNALPTLYGDMGVFGTGAIGVFEDDEEVIRVVDYPLGSFAIGLDGKRRVRVFSHLCPYTVQQIVETWGRVDPATGKADFERSEPTNLSLTVQNAWRVGNREQWIEVAQLIQPNHAYDGVKIESKYKRYESLYYETGSTDTGFLEHSGYDEFPILAARWKTSGNDVYGTDCPGMRALGDIKQLQYMEKKIAQAVEKELSPPLIGPAELRNTRVSGLPGDITFSSERDGLKGLRPIYEVKFNVADAEAKTQQIRDRLRRTFKVDTFLMFSSSDRREMTAHEVVERKDEKLVVLGPVFGRFASDVLGPLIERTVPTMDRAGLMPPAPQEIQGMPLSIEYVSSVAQALRSVTLSSLDRVAGAIGQVAQFIPDVLDRFNADAWVEHYIEDSGAPPTLIRSKEKAQQLRDARNQTAARNQGVDNLGTVAGAAKDLGAAPVEGNSALAKLVAGMRAKGTVAAGQTAVQ